MLMIALAIFYIILGCFLDGISMVVLTMGVILPTVQAAGFDLVWFGIFIVIVVEMAQITPPVGFNLFVLQGMTGKEITWIARVTMPFFFLMCGMSAVHAVLVLVLLGALTKSAQFPFHFWLPHAMAAPTPVSAYLHSATMVKAGVFLLIAAVAGAVGHAGMVLDRRRRRRLHAAAGRLCAMFQNDMKACWPIPPSRHLGLITLLLGLGSPLSAVAAIFHTMNHATFKASLFMAVGIIDHETGTRDMRRLRGLRA
jgi:NADH:ubiquinone oxidoreductase subunit 5 (subunit L)/multisubunit Na+/H+ antiporter MnhA subunit